MEYVIDFDSFVDTVDSQGIFKYHFNWGSLLKYTVFFSLFI